MPDGCWSTMWPLTTGKVLSRALEVPALLLGAISHILPYMAPTLGSADGLGAEENSSWPVKTQQGLGAAGLSLTLSSRSSFPRNPLDAKMGIPGNTVLEVMV